VTALELIRRIRNYHSSLIGSDVTQGQSHLHTQFRSAYWNHGVKCLAVYLEERRAQR
jgi:hypothetical protein